MPRNDSFFANASQTKKRPSPDTDDKHDHDPESGIRTEGEKETVAGGKKSKKARGSEAPKKKRKKESV